MISNRSKNAIYLCWHKVRRFFPWKETLVKKSCDLYVFKLLSGFQNVDHGLTGLTSWSDKFQGCFISFVWSQNKILSRISKLRIYYSVSLLPGKSFTGYVFSTIHSDLVTELFNEETKDISGLFRCVLSNNIDSVNTRVNTINVHTMPNVA